MMREWVDHKAIIDAKQGNSEGRQIAQRMRLVAAMVDPHPRQGDDFGRLAVALKPYADMIAEQVADHKGGIPSNIKELADEVEAKIVDTVEESKDDRRRWGIEHSETDQTPSLKQAVDSWLQLKRVHVDQNKIEDTTYADYVRRLGQIVDWHGADSKVEVVSDDSLERYYLFLVANTSPSKAKKQLMAYRQLAKHLQIKKLIPPLARLDDRDLRVSVERQEVETMPIEDWRQRYDGGNDEVRLFLLLMANCGMTQGDISKIKPSEVDWENGRIQRKRSKRAKSANAVVVNWKLWDETFSLLKKIGKRTGDYVLLNRNGDPLLRHSLKDDGKVKKVDNIRTAVNRLERRRGWSPVQLKRIRKTSASLLFNHADHARYAQYFLAHEPNDVAGQHYVKPNQNQLDTATEYLRQQYLGA